MSGDYTTQPARKGMFYAFGVAYDVLVLREVRGRYQVRLPDGVEVPIRFRSGSKILTLRPGFTTSVPISAVELR